MRILEICRTIRYLHTTGLRDFDEDAFAPIYEAWERAIYEPVLVFDVWVPVICQHFSFDDVRLSTEARIARMDEGLQLARSTEKYFKVALHETVAGAATHALVLENWSVQNNDYNTRREPFFEFHAFASVIEKADRYFAALRATTGADMGYGQVIALPTGWAEEWTAHLPFLYVVATRAYPDRFEDYGWLRKSSPISEEKAKAAGQLAEALGEANQNRLRLATRRLNMAFLRNEEADTVLDLTIGLEALLVGDSNSEITHKLALRLAALTRVEPHPTHAATELFRLVKRVYSYRSAVVHGTGKAEKNASLRFGRHSEFPLWM